MTDEVAKIREEAVFLRNGCEEDLLPYDEGDSEDGSCDPEDPEDPDWHLWEDLPRPAFLQSEDFAYFWDVDNRQDFVDALMYLHTQREEVSMCICVT
jgi:hypothetical protein